MNFFKKAFGKKSKQDKPTEKTAEEMRNDPDLIQIYDEYGREMFITKETWRKDILPGNIKDNWNNPDELYGIIVGALNDGFFADVLEAAKQLCSIDPVPVRASCVLGIVLMKNGKLDEAEEELNAYNDKFGEDGVIVTNIAKVQAERGMHEVAEKTLWRALELDPNQDNALQWWAAIHRERSGDVGYISALKEVAELKGSWRAQIWLARAALEQQDFEQARQYHNSVLSTLDVLPAEVIGQISGDLGNAGRIKDIIELLGNRFDPGQHGLMAGNNLIKAYIESSDPKSARQVLAQLYALNRPDWKEHLKYWEDQIDQASSRFGPVGNESPISITTLTLSWPVWAHKLSSHDQLLPIKKSDTPTILFISSTCEYQQAPDEVVVQKTDKEGTLCRAIPLFLAEKVCMTSSANAIVSIPVISGEGSFIMSAKPWAEDDLLKMAESSGADYIVTGHLSAKGAQWDFQVTLIKASEKIILDDFSHKIAQNDPSQDVMSLSHKVDKMLDKYCGINKEEPPINYHLPRPELFNMYLDGTSQSLALSVATSEKAGENTLYNERAIFDHLLGLALNDTGSDIAKLMFIGALSKNKAYGSSIYSEYQTKAEKLLKENPLSGKAADVANETMATLY